VIPPDNVDVILVAPKGSGRTVRSIFFPGAASIRALPCIRTTRGGPRSGPWRWALPSGPDISFPTTFEKEVYSDLVGERGVLMGCLAGVMEAQYDLLRRKGHTPVRPSTRPWKSSPRA
jgi:ketol-acid reductoisomerase